MEYEQLLTYLIEIRQRLIKIIVCFVVIFCSCYFFSNRLFQIVVSPLIKSLHTNSHLIATQIAAPVFTPMKLAWNLAFFLTMPYLGFQVWEFVKPAMYAKEINIMRAFMASSLALFISGLLFCYFIVLPFIFYFFNQNVPLGVQYLPDISSTLAFILHFLLIFGICFEVPLICVLLERYQCISLTQLRQIRPYVIVFAFIIGMLLTPPDVLSQILLAVPLCLLYELGIFLIKLTKK